VDLNHRPRPYQGLLWCYMHSIMFMKDVVPVAYGSGGSAAGAVRACHTGFEFIILGTDVRYSNRSAIIGSTLVARRAGK
jgi:hypothetical protein